MFFIFDYRGRIVGNPKGYKTHKGCIVALSSRTSINGEKWDKLRYYLFHIHKGAMDNGHTNNMVYRIVSI